MRCEFHINHLSKFLIFLMLNFSTFIIDCIAQLQHAYFSGSLFTVQFPAVIGAEIIVNSYYLKRFVYNGDLENEGCLLVALVSSLN